MRNQHLVLAMTLSLLVDVFFSGQLEAQYYGGYPSHCVMEYDAYGDPVFWNTARIDSDASADPALFPRDDAPIYRKRRRPYRYGPMYDFEGRVLAYMTPVPSSASSSTIRRSDPTAGMVAYTHNGNSGIYVPGGSYPSVRQQPTTEGLGRTSVLDGPQPLALESPLSNFPRSNSRTSPRLTPSPPLPGQEIKLRCPKAASGPLNYSLNGLVYTIYPGYSQTFSNDRLWMIAFQRGNESSETVSYQLRSGVYFFVADAQGWNLQQPDAGNSPAPDVPSLMVPPPPRPSS